MKTLFSLLMSVNLMIGGIKPITLNWVIWSNNASGGNPHVQMSYDYSVSEITEIWAGIANVPCEYYMDMFINVDEVCDADITVLFTAPSSSFKPKFLVVGATMNTSNLSNAEYTFTFKLRNTNIAYVRFIFTYQELKDYYGYTYSSIDVGSGANWAGKSGDSVFSPQSFVVNNYVTKAGNNPDYTSILNTINTSIGNINSFNLNFRPVIVKLESLLDDLNLNFNANIENIDLNIERIFDLGTVGNALTKYIEGCAISQENVMPLNYDYHSYGEEVYYWDSAEDGFGVNETYFGEYAIVFDYLNILNNGDNYYLPLPDITYNENYMNVGGYDLYIYDLDSNIIVNTHLEFDYVGSNWYCYIKQYEINMDTFVITEVSPTDYILNVWLVPLDTLDYYETIVTYEKGIYAILNSIRLPDNFPSIQYEQIEYFYENNVLLTISTILNNTNNNIFGETLLHTMNMIYENITQPFSVFIQNTGGEQYNPIINLMGYYALGIVFVLILGG